MSTTISSSFFCIGIYAYPAFDALENIPSRASNALKCRNADVIINNPTITMVTFMTTAANKRKSKGAAGQLRAGPSGVVRCPECFSYYYENCWHDQFLSWEQLARLHCTPGSVGHRQCPACSMIRSGHFEGKVVIKHAPENLQRLLLSTLIKLICIGSREKDCQQRLIAISEKDENITVTTTENQLAIILAKKIKDVFKKVDVLIRPGDLPSDATLATVDFNGTSQTE